MTFIYDLDSYYLEIYWTCVNELPTSRLSKVIVSYIHIDRQTDIAEIIYHAASLVVNKSIDMLHWRT